MMLAPLHLISVGDPTGLEVGDVRVLTVKVEDGMYELLDRVRRDKGVTISVLVRRALEEYMSKYVAAEKCVETRRIRVCD